MESLKYILISCTCLIIGFGGLAVKTSYLNQSHVLAIVYWLLVATLLISLYLLDLKIQKKQREEEKHKWEMKEHLFPKFRKLR